MGPDDRGNFLCALVGEGVSSTGDRHDASANRSATGRQNDALPPAPGRNTRGGTAPTLLALVPGCAAEHERLTKHLLDLGPLDVGRRAQGDEPRFLSATLEQPAAVV